MLNLRWPRGGSVVTRLLITEDMDCVKRERSSHSMLNVAVTMESEKEFGKK